MLKFDLINVQAIGEAHIEIEDNTICEFVGNNSNGKSILSKCIEYLTKGDMVHKDVREALIKDTAQSAVILITVGKKQLGVVLQHELKDCIMMYVPNIDKENEPGGKILRPLGDTNGCEAIVKEFGFRVYAKGDICLQLAPTFGAIPYVTTSGSVNNDITTDITTDRFADEFLNTFSKITFPVFKKRVQKIKQEKENLQAVLDNMESYDWRAYEKIAAEMKVLYDAICSYEDVDIKEIPVPNLAIPSVPFYEILDIPVPDPNVLAVLRTESKINIIGKELSDYVAILNGVCPTCGKPLI